MVSPNYGVGLNGSCNDTNTCTANYTDCVNGTCVCNDTHFENTNAECRATPLPPQNLQVSVTDFKTLTVTWEAPQTPNGVITGYSIQYKGNDAATWKTSDFANVLTGRLVNLNPCTEYNVKVAAKTKIGVGEYTSSVKKKTAVKTPGTVSNLILARESTSSLRATWTNPTEICDFNLHIKVFLKDGSGERKVNERPIAKGTKTYLITGLLAYTEYYAIVYTSNTAGDSVGTKSNDARTTIFSVNLKISPKFPVNDGTEVFLSCSISGTFHPTPHLALYEDDTILKKEFSSDTLTLKRVIAIADSGKIFKCIASSSEAGVSVTSPVISAWVHFKPIISKANVVYYQPGQTISEHLVVDENPKSYNAYCENEDKIVYFANTDRYRTKSTWTLSVNDTQNIGYRTWLCKIENSVGSTLFTIVFKERTPPTVSATSNIIITAVCIIKKRRAAEGKNEMTSNNLDAKNSGFDEPTSIEMNADENIYETEIKSAGNDYDNTYTYINANNIENTKPIYENLPNGIPEPHPSSRIVGDPYKSDYVDANAALATCFKQLKH